MTPLLATTYILLAQSTIDPSIDRFLEFIAKITMLVGISVVFMGGWKIHRGEAGDGILAIIGGFIIALAVPIIKFLFSIA